VILLKRVLITGANSYVGTNVEKWLMKEPDKYYVETLDMKDPNWRDFDFSKFDVVFHVAGIAHIKETKKNRDLFIKINSDLAIDTANIAKKHEINHFIFMSSMSVFGKVCGEIKRDTDAVPVSSYGKSKLDAENRLKALEDDAFKITILRPPLIYGRYCPGNFSKLAKFALINPFYPKRENKRSVLYIDNFSNYICKLIDKNLSGVFHPQNNRYVSTNEIISSIRSLKNKKTIISKAFNWTLAVNKKLSRKIYGSLYYGFFDDLSLDENYTFLETIELTIEVNSDDKKN